MSDDEIRGRLQQYEDRLAQERERRAQLQAALQQAQASVLQLEGACLGLRELLEPPDAPAAAPLPSAVEAA